MFCVNLWSVNTLEKCILQISFVYSHIPHITGAQNVLKFPKRTIEPRNIYVTFCMHFIHWQSQSASGNPRSHDYVFFLLPVRWLTIYQQEMFNSFQLTEKQKKRITKLKMKKKTSSRSNLNWKSINRRKGNKTKKKR